MAGARYFFLLQKYPDQLCDPLICLLLSGSGVFLGLKWLGTEADHLIPNGTESRNVWCYTSTPLVSLWQAFGHRYRYVSGFNKNFADNFWSSKLNSLLCCVLNVCNLFFLLLYDNFDANNNQNLICFGKYLTGSIVRYDKIA